MNDEDPAELAQRLVDENQGLWPFMTETEQALFYAGRALGTEVLANEKLTRLVADLFEGNAALQTRLHQSFLDRTRLNRNWFLILWGFTMVWLLLSFYLTGSL